LTVLTHKMTEQLFFFIVGETNLGYVFLAQESAYWQAQLEPWLDGRGLLVTGGAVLGLAVLLGLFYLVSSRIKAQKDEQVNNPNDLLSQFRNMKDEGELTEEEFRNIKLRMASQFSGKSESENR